MKLRWAVFASGRGSNFKNFLTFESSLRNQSIVCLHADRLCPAAQLAEEAQKSVLVLSPKISSYEERLLAFLRENDVNAIFLLGFMRLLKPGFLNRWKGAIVNLHPSRLPDFKGRDAIRQAHEAGVKTLGVSLHRVVEQVDSGEILRQKVFERDFSLSLEALELEFHRQEHELVRQFVFDLDRDESFRLALGGQ
jgi:phosphoribosylglycinamide formyltransferase-1